MTTPTPLLVGVNLLFLQLKLSFLYFQLFLACQISAQMSHIWGGFPDLLNKVDFYFMALFYFYWGNIGLQHCISFRSAASHFAECMIPHPFAIKLLATIHHPPGFSLCPFFPHTPTQVLSSLGVYSNLVWLALFLCILYEWNLTELPFSFWLISLSKFSLSKNSSFFFFLQLSVIASCKQTTFFFGGFWTTSRDL